MIHSPYIRKPASVQRVMFTVLLALLPGIAAYVWQIGAGILVNLAIASVTAVVAEALILALRKRPVAIGITDLSAVVTAWLVVLAFPPIVPWWLTMLAVLIAIVAVKHLYGGLGQNPFNPAMAAYCTMIVAYPSLMSQWPAAGTVDFAAQLSLILGGARDLDGITGATALDALRTGLRGDSTVDALLQTSTFGLAGGRGWEWIAAGYLVGGLFLIATRTITWHLPTGFLAGLAMTSGVFWLLHPDQFASPLFHLASGG
ncbi:MAG: RnfABCDGE type electron transport complex subunit D, partial [Azoarcus sp.]|nr:RnfABCDGE type electron transport complex subunit D [Azoarcus sp.]